MASNKIAEREKTLSIVRPEHTLFITSRDTFVWCGIWSPRIHTYDSRLDPLDSRRSTHMMRFLRDRVLRRTATSSRWTVLFVLLCAASSLPTVAFAQGGAEVAARRGLLDQAQQARTANDHV